jgi:DNA-directed RNA polymerase specialized sigma subunit
MAVKEKVLQKREELRRLREKKSGWFFQLLVIQDKIMNEPDPDKRLWLEERMQRLRDRIERISKKIAAKASCLVTHQDLAQVLGVSKGTVDSSIFYLKRKRKTHQVSSSSEDIQSLHSLQR